MEFIRALTSSFTQIAYLQKYVEFIGALTSRFTQICTLTIICGIHWSSNIKLYPNLYTYKICGILWSSNIKIYPNLYTCKNMWNSLELLVILCCDAVPWEQDPAGAGNGLLEHSRPLLWQILSSGFIIHSKLTPVFLYFTFHFPVKITLQISGKSEAF